MSIVINLLMMTPRLIDWPVLDAWTNEVANVGTIEVANDGVMEIVCASILSLCSPCLYVMCAHLALC